MLRSIHESLTADEPPPPWPDIIPAAHKNKLEPRHGLRDRLSAYKDVVAVLDEEERQAIIRTLREQNEIDRLVSCNQNCDSIDSLPQPVQGPVRALFDFAFTLLKDFGIRDRLYEAVYSEALFKACPFCGLEYFDSPEGYREDLDHYLAKSKYPFAAANLRNLVPMGMKCNQSYKGTDDILRDDIGVRRRSFNPYDHGEIKISLEGSDPFGGTKDHEPRWQVDFHPDSEECTTWDNVFHVRTRYIRDILCPNYPTWLRGFESWIKIGKGNPDPTPEESLEAIRQYAESLPSTGHCGGEFLRKPVFQMLHKHCEGGNDRLLNLIRDFLIAGYGT